MENVRSAKILNGLGEWPLGEWPPRADGSLTDFRASGVFLKECFNAPEQGWQRVGVRAFDRLAGACPMGIAPAAGNPSVYTTDFRIGIKKYTAELAEITERSCGWERGFLLAFLSSTA